MILHERRYRAVTVRERFLAFSHRLVREPDTGTGLPNRDREGAGP